MIAVSRDKQGNRIDDDGCGDGRGVGQIIQKTTEGIIIREKSLDRAKVFGGAAAMTAAMKIGLGEAAGDSLQSVFHESIETLKNKQIDFGAHTGYHTENKDCGCGAIDKAPESIQAAVEYKDEIQATIASLGLDMTGLDTVFSNFESYATQIAGQDYKGKDVAEEIIDNGKIVKELNSGHNEMYIVLNTVADMTVNQELVRSLSEEQVQVFGVDVWRMQELAHREYDNLAEKQQAFLGELVYTLGVAAVLTAGDLPVYITAA